MICIKAAEVVLGYFPVIQDVSSHHHTIFSLHTLKKQHRGRFFMVNYVRCVSVISVISGFLGFAGRLLHGWRTRIADGFDFFPS